MVSIQRRLVALAPDWSTPPQRDQRPARTLMSTPLRGLRSGYCARAASGRTAAPPHVPLNSGPNYHIVRRLTLHCAAQQDWPPIVRSGSKRESALFRLMSASAGCGHAVAIPLDRNGTGVGADVCSALRDSPSRRYTYGCDWVLSMRRSASLRSIMTATFLARK